MAWFAHGKAPNLEKIQEKYSFAKNRESVVKAVTKINIQHVHNSFFDKNNVIRGGN